MTNNTVENHHSDWRTPRVVLLVGCLIAMIGFGTRSVFGLFLDPMTQSQGWDRETFALAMALQNLLWGIGVPIAGAISDRFGPVKVIAIGALLYAAGVYGMSQADTPGLLHMTGGLLTGVGVAFTSFSLAMAAMARVVSPERRSFALGLGTAAGSFGQVIFSPITQGFIGSFGWTTTLMYLAAFVLILIPLAMCLPSSSAVGTEASQKQTLRQALGEARGHKGYVLLTVGFFVCGFHVAFITVHFPAYVKDIGLDASVGAWAIALVGLFNIAGSFMAGVAGQKYSKPYTLSLIYFLRAIVIFELLMAPVSAMTIYIFSAAMGLLWLSTVPLTTAIVAHVFGIRYMATLFGIVFLSHQLGSFLGVWMGGRIYDLTGSYDLMWWAGIVMGLIATVIHIPIRDVPVARLRPAATNS